MIERGDFLAALARHHDIIAELAPLVASWRAAGIEALVYKGFHLSAFIYPTPGMRYHGDVDLLLPRDRADDAIRIALERGWRHIPGEPVVGTDLPVHLRMPGGATQLDLHFEVLRPRWGWRRPQRRASDAMWEGSKPAPLPGTTVRIPDPVDALLIGLILDRCHVEDFRGLKPSDAVDARMLMERGSVTEDALRSRARELGCPRTLETFLQWSLHPVASQAGFRPSRRERLRAQLSAFGECGYIPTYSVLRRALRAPSLVRDILLVWPDVLRVRRALAQRGDIATALGRLLPALPPAAGRVEQRRQVIRGVRWAFRLLPLGPAAGDCLPRAAATWLGLRRRGWPVSLVTGVARIGERLVGHAWVEDAPGQVMEELGEPECPRRYTEGFRCPPLTPAASPHPASGAAAPAS